MPIIVLIILAVVLFFIAVMVFAYTFDYKDKYAVWLGILFTILLTSDVVWMIKSDQYRAIVLDDYQKVQMLNTPKGTVATVIFGDTIYNINESSKSNVKEGTIVKIWHYDVWSKWIYWMNENIQTTVVIQWTEEYNKALEFFNNEEIPLHHKLHHN